KFFGVYPQKGAIAPGSDADIVIWDPEATHTISAKTSHHRTDYNLYEGMKVTGMPVVTMSRGRVLVENGEWKGEVGLGRFVPRHRFDRPGEMREAKGAKATKAAGKAKVPAG